MIVLNVLKDNGSHRYTMRCATEAQALAHMDRHPDNIYQEVPGRELPDHALGIIERLYPPLELRA